MQPQPSWGRHPPLGRVPSPSLGRTRHGWLKVLLSPALPGFPGEVLPPSPLARTGTLPGPLQEEGATGKVTVTMRWDREELACTRVGCCARSLRPWRTQARSSAALPTALQKTEQVWRVRCPCTHCGRVIAPIGIFHLCCHLLTASPLEAEGPSLVFGLSQLRWVPGVVRPCAQMLG